MIKSNDFQKAIEFINKSNSILITTHSKPDGDACGSITALHEALTALGKKVKILLLSPLPKWYTFLFTEKVSILDQDIQPEEIMKGRFGKFDLVIVVDTNSYSQLPKFEQYLKQSDIPILVIDHHVTGDNLGTVELVDSKIAASALIVHDLFKYAKWPVTKNIAQALFLAVASDTGWFRFRNTDARVFQVCAELIKAGAKPEELYGKLNHNFSESRFRLMLRMLNYLELDFNGRYASYQLTREDFKQTGASYEDTENFIDEGKRISSVEVIAFFVELEDGRIKCSMRSTESINVCNIMMKFGGGGHAMAASSTHYGSIEEVKRKIRSEIRKQFSS